MKTFYSIYFVTIFSFAGNLSAGEPHIILNDKNPYKSSKWNSHRVDSHAPIGIMGDHTHEAGEAMLSYRYMYMDMRPNFVGSDQVSVASVQGPPTGSTFPIVPTDMQTQMHMLGAMWAPSSSFTFAGMLPYIDKAMDHSVVTGSTFRTHTEGIGDFKFGGLLKVFDRRYQRVHLNLMASAPTGSIEEQGFVPPAGRVLRLPYPMQLGSGTWDLLPGITYLGQANRLSWGSQLSSAVRLGENNFGYSLGDEIAANGWIAYQLSDPMSVSFRASWKHWNDIDGADPNIVQGPVATARPDLRGGERVDLFGGMNFYFQKGIFKGHRLAVEAGGSVWQDLDGPQLGMDWMTIVGWQKAF